MAKHYSPKDFLRRSPNRFLKQYFSSRDIILPGIDFDHLQESDAESVYQAWLQLPDDLRGKIEKDFQEIDSLANEFGSKAIKDEASFHDEELTDHFAELKGFYEQSFWTFLERTDYWRGAVGFHYADSIPTSQWRKRKNIPRKPAIVDPETIRYFEEALGNYFYTMQGRGKNCKVDCYKRGEIDYFFAYAQDFTNSIIAWEGKELCRRPHHPAFEVIFVFSQQEGRLDIHLPGEKKPIPDLQEIFAEMILQEELPADEEDQRVYDLTPLLSSDPHFVYAPESGIEKVIVKKIRVRVYGKSQQKILLETSALSNKNEIFDLYQKTTQPFLPSQIFVDQVGIQVTFVRGPFSRRNPARTFDITLPNACNLKHDKYGLILRKMLADSGIEPKEPTKEDDAA